MIIKPIQIPMLIGLCLLLTAEASEAFNDPINCIPPMDLVENASVSVLSVTTKIQPTTFSAGASAAISDVGYNVDSYIIAPSDLERFLAQNTANYTIVLAEDDLQDAVSKQMYQLPESNGIAVFSAIKDPGSSSIDLLEDSQSMAIEVGVPSVAASDGFVSGYAVGSYIGDSMQGTEIPFSSLISELKEAQHAKHLSPAWRK